MNHKYSVHIVWSEEDRAFVARVFELPGCFADGITREEALKNLDAVVSEWIETAKSLNREIPEPAGYDTQEKLAGDFCRQVKAPIPVAS